jgi:hypothetical protein
VKKETSGMATGYQSSKRRELFLRRFTVLAAGSAVASRPSQKELFYLEDL